MKQELNIEADGLLGTAVKQALTDASTKAAQPQAGTQWQIRDTSDGSAVHLRMFRTVNLTEAQTAVAQSSTGGFDVGTMNVHADDWGLARHYSVRIVVTPIAPTGPPGTPGAPTGPLNNDAAGQQVAKAILAGMTYDYYVALPGMVTATNGVPGDQSRLVWHLDFASGAERVLTAESIYPDVPRLIVLLLAIVLFAGLVIIRSRTRRPITAERPEIFTKP